MDTKAKRCRVVVGFIFFCCLIFYGVFSKDVYASGIRSFSKVTPVLKSAKYSEDGIKIKWNRVDNAAGYHIYRKDGDGKWELYDTVKQSKKYTDTYAETGIRYQYAIKGYTYYKGKKITTKISKESKVIEGIPKKIENVSATYKSDTYVLIKWDENVEASGYYIYQSTGKAWRLLSTIDDATVCSYKDYNIQKGEAHYYKVIPYEIIDGNIYDGYLDVSEAIAYSASGIDVSYHNGNISWSDVKADGIDFAFIRAGYGDPDKKAGGVVDKKFARNIKYARKNGIKVGVYLYSYAESVSDAKKEARFLVRLLKKYGELDYPVAYDFENFNRKNFKYKKQNTKIIAAFCKIMQDAGYDTLVYSDYNMLTKYVDYNKLKKYGFWVAYWTFDPKRYPVKLENVLIWQYSDKGRIDGISERTDRNVKFSY